MWRKKLSMRTSATRPIGRGEEAWQRLGGHGADEPDEEAHEQVFEAAQGDVSPAGELKIAAEESTAELPEEFRECADGAEPGAEGFFEQQAHEQEGEKRNMAAG